MSRWYNIKIVPKIVSIILQHYFIFYSATIARGINTNFLQKNKFKATFKKIIFLQNLKKKLLKNVHWVVKYYFVL